MLFVTGDTHGGEAGGYEKILQFDKSYKHSEEQDYLVICGDFGFIWNNLDEDNEVQARKYLDELNQKEYMVCFVDGNHECFPRINRYPIEEWNGGKIHRIKNNIIHLMRGQVYVVDGKTWFTFGGAESTDKMWRTPGVSWWPEETPSLNEYNEAIKNLKKCNFAVDYVFTHAMPYMFLKDIGIHAPMTHYSYSDYQTPLYLQDFYRMIDFKQWFCGHYHLDAQITSRLRICYHDIRVVADGKNYSYIDWE